MAVLEHRYVYQIENILVDLGVLNSFLKYIDKYS